MKKTLVALAVLAAAGSVNAAEVYNNDGVSVSVSGAGEVQYIQKYEQTGTDVSPEVRVDDAQINVTVGVDVSEDLTALAGLNQTFETDNDSTSRTVSSDGAFVGLASATLGTVTFGDQYLIADDAGIGADFEVGYNQYGQADTQSSDVIKYVYDNGEFYFGLSHNLDENDTATTGDTHSTDGRIGYRVGGLDARLYVFKGTDASANDEDSYNLEAVYTFNDAWSMAASYGNTKIETSANVETTDANYAEINATYTVDKNSFSLGYAYYDEDVANVSSSNLYGVVVHKLNANVRAYAELGYVDYDNNSNTNEDMDLAYTVGMEVSF
ncbi:porin [Vibrio sp.]|nr:porin [Vibrio sp.]